MAPTETGALKRTFEKNVEAHRESVLEIQPALKFPRQLAPENLPLFTSEVTQPDLKSPHSRIQVHKNGWDATNWDLDTQQPHGGQEWSSISNFKEDFSVTTNYLGPPVRAISACGVAMGDVEHYPPANFEPYISELAALLDPEQPQDMVQRLLLGNGASELIDLVTRVGAHEGAFTVPNSAQYKEYERAALAAGRAQVKEAQGNDFRLLAIVNPCNPTGDYLSVHQMKAYIEKTCETGTTVLVDESMQLWYGPNWRDDSLVSQADWIQKLHDENDIRIYIIHSWTKIWSCPGIRLGSVVCPTVKLAADIKKHQVPWSLNVFALRFLSAAIEDTGYLQRTWSSVPRLRQRTVEQLSKMFPRWEFHGEAWLSWVWIDTRDAAVAEQAVKLAKAAGVPLRNGAMGYGLPTFIRAKVADEMKQDILFAALAPMSAA
jgi:histidinol-phosphate/aromatic aminotransferase/cobyric acid decarboxylase-like protein